MTLSLAWIPHACVCSLAASFSLKIVFTCFISGLPVV
jgi:hypothetical protein